MTIAARPHLNAEAASFAPLGTMGLAGESFNELVTETASMTLNTNGTFSGTNSFETPANSLPANWFTPTTVSVGNGYQVRFTLQSGLAWDAGLTSGVLYALSSARTLTWSIAYAEPGVDKTAVVLVEILTTGGAPYKSGTLNVNLYNGEA